MSVAKAYAKALYETASVGKGADQDLAQLEAQMGVFVSITQASAEAKTALFGPVTTAKEKMALIDAIGKKASVSELLTRFLVLLVRKGRLSLLPQIQEAFTAVRVQAEGGMIGTVVAADPVSQADVDSLAQAFTRKLGKRVTFRASTDASLLAGMRVTVNGVTYDGTLRSQLQKLRDSLTQVGSAGRA